MLLPPPAHRRTPLVPLLKVISALLLPLWVFKRATGDGMKTLPSLASSANATAAGDARLGSAAQSSSLNGGTGGIPAVGGTADPVAERRRERALRALDKKLAELRSTMRGGGPAAGGGAGAVPALNGGDGGAGGGEGLSIGGSIPSPPVSV